MARLYRAADETDEARFVATEIAHLLRTGELAEPAQAAVLVRTNAQARALVDALRGRGIRVRVRAETDLLVRAEVRDLVAYLRLAHNPDDGPALARILDTPPRRLRLVERAFRRQPVPTTELRGYAQKRGGAPARHAVENLLALLGDLHAGAHELRPVAVLQAVLDRTGYTIWLASQHDGPGRLVHVESLHRLLEHTTAPDLATWLADLHLGGPSRSLTSRPCRC